MIYNIIFKNKYRKYRKYKKYRKYRKYRKRASAGNRTRISSLED